MAAPSDCRGFATNFGRQRISDQDIEKGLTAYSHDLLEELARELTDVYPEAKDLLYYFLDADEVLTAARLNSILKEANINPDEAVKVIDFLLYYGVLGTRLGDIDHFIFSVNYDLKVLKIRANRHTEAADYVVNPAFWPALGIRTSRIAALDKEMRRQSRLEAHTERIEKVRAIPTALLAKVGWRLKESPWVPLRKDKRKLS